MTNQKNELPDEVFLERMFLCQGAEPMTHGTVYAGISDLEKRDLEKYVRADLRPAKAVQGDKAEALKKFDKMMEYVEFALGNQFNRTAELVRAALTPESEGIAGKGDQAEAVKRLQKIEKYFGLDPVDSKNIGEDFEYIKSTLARPQEIDVASIRKLRDTVYTLCSETTGDLNEVAGHALNQCDDLIRAALSAQAAPMEKIEGLGEAHNHVLMEMLVQKKGAEHHPFWKSIDKLLQAARLYAQGRKQNAPAGWKLVPIEPDVDMLFFASDVSSVNRKQCEVVYKAMLSAASQPNVDNTTKPCNK